jgi:hypothetical protein
MRTDELTRVKASKEYSLANLLDIVLIETYALISDNIDIGNSYSYDQEGSSIWSFEDKHLIKHIEKINYNPGVKDKAVTIKFFWLDNNKPNYDKPPYTDEKVFNTHLNIFVKEILPKLEDCMSDFNIDKITLDPTDNLRYRLYRLALNTVLKNTDYKIEEDSQNRLLYIKKK